MVVEERVVLVFLKEVVDEIVVCVAEEIKEVVKVKL